LLKFITITSNLNQWFLGPVVGVGDEGEAVTVSPDPNPQIMREWSRLLLVQTMIILIPSSFVSMRRCDSDSRLEPCVHVLLKVAFGNVGVLSPFLYFHWLRFFFFLYRFNSDGAVCLWSCWFLELLYIFQKLPLGVSRVPNFFARNFIHLIISS
jgi:hypothetical protein